MKFYLVFLLSLISLLEGFNIHSYNFNLKIKKPLDCSIINFIKIHNINYFKVKENPKYLILRYLHEPLDDVYNYNIFDIIKNNNKPVIISYEKKNINNTLNYKYSYLIYNSTSYLSKYTLNYNNNIYRYSFDINASETDKYETNWYIKSKHNSRINSNITNNYIKNWIEYNINNNYLYYYYKKYLLFNYYYNKQLSLK
jgi:hypothetical protein